MPERVRITDVSPRDGLQNEPIAEVGGPIPTTRKADLVRASAASGVDEVEITSFVSAKWMPQLGDAPELCAHVAEEARAWRCARSALVPNERGMDRLEAVNAEAGYALIDKVSVFVAVSETFSQRNTNAGIAASIDRVRPVLARTRASGLKTRGYVSCVVECPFEGAIEAEAVARVSAALAEAGAEEIDLGDTIGAGTPETIARVLEAVVRAIGEPGGADHPRITVHLHDTFARAGACVRTALDAGVRSFDASFGGLGGCPYATTNGRRAPGNIAMRTLLDTVESAGFTHRVVPSAAARADDIARSCASGVDRR